MAWTKSGAINGRKNAILATGEDEKNDTDPAVSPAISITKVARSSGPPMGKRYHDAAPQMTPDAIEKARARFSFPVLTAFGRGRFRSRRQLSSAGIQRTSIVATRPIKKVRSAWSQYASAMNPANRGFATKTVGNCRTRFTACDTRRARWSSSESSGTVSCIPTAYCAARSEARLL